MSTRGRILAFVGLWLTVAVGILSAPGCYGRNCEGGIVTFGIDAGQGQMVTETAWESSPQDGEWLPFPRQRAYVFDVRALGGRTPYESIPYLSASPHPAKDGSNYVVGAGNIAEMVNVGPNRITLINDTCSDYFLRLTLKVPPLPPQPQPEPEPAPSAANDADASL